MPVLAGLCTTSAEFVRSLQRYFVALRVRRLRCEIVAMLSLTSIVVELPQLVHGIENIWVPRSNIFTGDEGDSVLDSVQMVHVQASRENFHHPCPPSFSIREPVGQRHVQLPRAFG